jgi:RNA polymerase sigma-70 factor (ECF subfamily)
MTTPLRDTDELLALARKGNVDAFSQLIESHRAELRAHCYRMLGSVHDAEDAVQETMVRAWKGFSGFAGRSSLRTWLYAIATNAALDTAGHRSRRELPMDMTAPSGAGSELAESRTDLAWLEPYPDRWLVPSAQTSPEARYEQRESIELAFVVAVQHLPPLQRAALLLREVAGFSAAEIATQLGTSVASVTSALQRARASIAETLPARSQQSALRQLGDRRARELVARYCAAIEHADIDGLVSMLTEDVTWSMPPVPTWFRGKEAAREFLLRYPLTDTWVHVPVSGGASGQLGVGGYVLDTDTSELIPGAIDVLTVRDGKIAGVTGFLTADILGPPHDSGWISGADLFARFGLPPRPPAP